MWLGRLLRTGAACHTAQRGPRIACAFAHARNKSLLRADWYGHLHSLPTPPAHKVGTQHTSTAAIPREQVSGPMDSSNFDVPQTSRGEKNNSRYVSTGAFAEF